MQRFCGGNKYLTNLNKFYHKNKLYSIFTNKIT